ncbi:MAG: hypothetical protein E7310_02575 [Clostridiales bacterium]|nr:hypothetical protein [Clostridiales bacterium]
MDNASKALLMAAEILIAILILTLVIYAFVYYRDVAVTYEKSQISQETEKINSQFTKYLGQDVTIQEIVTLVHLAQDYNAKVDDGVESANGKKNKVEIIIDNIRVPSLYGGLLYNNVKLTGKTDNELIKYIELNTSIDSIASGVTLRKFECFNIEYNEEGKVYKVEFQ